MSEKIHLGALPGAGASRDATHVAIAPALPAEILYPGQHVGIVGGKASGAATEKIGIVDPFLRHPVYPGTAFWLCMYPDSIEGLRHEWTHAAFAERAAPEVEIVSRAVAAIDDYDDDDDCCP